MSEEGNFITDHSRQRWIVFSVAFAAFMVVLDDYIVNISLPTIAHYFNVSTGTVVYVTIAYLLFMTATLPIFGKIGDRVGLKRTFVLGFIVFTIGSFLCGISVSVEMLIGCRCIQGIGGSMLYAVGAAMIPRYLPQHNRGWAFGLTSVFSGLGIALGAPIGGFITSALGWHWVFLVNVPIGIAAVFVVSRVIPNDRTLTIRKEKRAPFDLPGAILCFLGLVSLIYAINKGQDFGWISAPTLSLFAAAIILTAAFIIWERRCKDPLLDFSLFKIRSYCFASLAMFAAFALYAGSNFLMPFYLILVKGLSSEIAGLVILIYAVVYMPIGSTMGRLSDKISIYILPSVGLVSATIASVFFASTLGFIGLLPAIIYIAWLGLSFGTFVSPNNKLVMSAVPQNMQGIATGVNRTLQHLGMIIGVSLFEAIFSMVMPHTSLDMSLSRAAVPQDLLISGFHYAYIAGAAICVIGFIFSLLTRNRLAKNKN